MTIITYETYYTDAPSLAFVSEAAEAYGLALRALLLATDDERELALKRFRDAAATWRNAVRDEAWRRNDVAPIDRAEAYDRARRPIVLLLSDMLKAGALADPVEWVQRVSDGYEERASSKPFELV